MDIKENTHSRNVRQILNSKEGFIPALEWNLSHWFPQSEKRVQFIVKKKDFHGVVCIDVDYKSENVFIVGYADFNVNSVSQAILVHKSELIDFISNLKPNSAPHRAPQDNEVPNESRKQDSFFL